MADTKIARGRLDWGIERSETYSLRKRLLRVGREDSSGIAQRFCAVVIRVCPLVVVVVAVVAAALVAAALQRR
jgi:hypothetical protein